MRLNISKKVFLLFVTLTSLTILVGCALYFGLRDLRVANGEVLVLRDFQFQIKELSAFQIGQEKLLASPEQTRFEKDFAKASQLLSRMKTFQANLGPEMRKKIETVETNLGYYRQAFTELFAKYQRDQLLHQRQWELGDTFLREIKSSDPGQQLALHEYFQRMQALFEKAHQQRDPGLLAAMREIGNEMVSRTDNAAIGKIVGAHQENAEAMYVNFLGMVDREDFLSDTAGHFHEFATETAREISALSRKRQDTLAWVIVSLSLFSVLLTGGLWWGVSRYFRGFLHHQRKAILAIEAGIYDYEAPATVPNDEIGDLTLFMKELAENLKESIEQVKSSEKEVRLAKEEWERTFDAIGDIVTIQDEDMRIIRVNHAGCQAFGAGPEALVGKHCYEMFRGEAAVCEGCPVSESIADFKPYSAEIEHPALGKIFWVSAAPVFDEGGELKRIIHFAKDITEVKKLEAQFLQAQKMEAIGRLSSGVAHDFNNILTCILGYSELLLLKEPGYPSWKEEVEVIKHAGEKAAALVRQLLTFSRRQQLDIRIVNVNDIITSLHKMMTRMIREDVVLDPRLEESVHNIKADPGQIEQIIMNLVVNARDAMPAGGRISIGTANVMIDKEYARLHVNMKPAAYVVITVADTGHGMSREVRERIFEPFFTTKQPGMGTGLGLATVYNIVKQHNGYIDVDSETGKGTTFRIIFPVTTEAAKAIERPAEPEESGRGNETILVVDDEPAILRMVVDSLSPLGYKLLGAASGEEALEVAEQFSGGIDLLLTDIIMPGMYGTELASRIVRRWPETRVLFMSGYLDAGGGESDIAVTEKNFLVKPVMPSSLMKKIREVFSQSGVQVDT
ncbi:MAG: response regulator [Deltaproteobacteria bacterium]|nr:response regulator [Deltaproteobacteria bacterium]